MVYECLRCKAAQRSGAVACPYCGTEFSGPVPADATLPERPAPGPHPLPDLAKGQAPLPPAWVMPTIPPTPTAEPYRQRANGTQTLVVGGSVLAAIALILLVWWLYTLGQSAAPPSPDTSASSAPTLPPLNSPPPATGPATVEAPVAAPNSGDPTTLAAPVGRWMDKEYDYYDFESGGSGTRGNVGGGQPPQPFTYVVVKKQLHLMMRGNGGAQKVSFSYGPGSNVIYIQQSDGSYLEYTRQG